jgi:hypothetical protein
MCLGLITDFDYANLSSLSDTMRMDISGVYAVGKNIN